MTRQRGEYQHDYWQHVIKTSPAQRAKRAAAAREWRKRTNYSLVQKLAYGMGVDAAEARLILSQLAAH